VCGLPLSVADETAAASNCSQDTAGEKRPTVAELLRRYAPGYLEKKQHELPDYVVKTLTTLAACRTPQLGGHKWRCAACQHIHYSYNSCHCRFCPTCGDGRREAWFENVTSWLLPIRYYHAVFTLDHRLCPLILANAKQLYGLLFDSVRRALIELAKDPNQGIAAKMGLMMMLHSWGQAMLAHPHVHVVIPAGAFRVTDGSWITVDSDEFFLDQEKLADRYRHLFIKGLKRLHRRGELAFPEAFSHLADENTFLNWLSPIATVRWHIHTCQPEHVHRPGAALQYLSRYVVGTAISDVRIVSDVDGEVTIRIKDYRNGGEKTALSMPGDEFVRRFAMHILPPRFSRARYAGWLGSRERARNLAMARAALHVTAPREKQLGNEQPLELEELFSGEVADTTYPCPNCRQRKLRWVEEIPAAMGWQRFRSQVPPSARARQAATRTRQLAAHNIRPPPAAPRG